MRTLYIWLLRLYPPSVRREFGDEMLGVFDEAAATARENGRGRYLDFCAREISGMLLGTRLHRGVIQGAVAGAILAAVAGYAVCSRPYTSTAIIRLAPSQIPERLVAPNTNLKLSTVSPMLTQTITSRGNLLGIVHRYDLYPAQRERMPDEDVVEQMRTEITTETPNSETLRISFRYPDRVLAQKVTADLVSRFMTDYSRVRTTQSVLTSQFLKEQMQFAGAEWDEAQSRLSDKSTPRTRLDADIARQHYEHLSARYSESRMSEEMERRQQGPTLELLEPASLPGPEHSLILVWLWAAWGALAGAVTGSLVALFISRWRDRRLLATAR